MQNFASNVGVLLDPVPILFHFPPMDVAPSDTTPLDPQLFTSHPPSSDTPPPAQLCYDLYLTVHDFVMLCYITSHYGFDSYVCYRFQIYYGICYFVVVLRVMDLDFCLL